MAEEALAQQLKDRCGGAQGEYKRCFDKWYRTTFLAGGTDEECKPLFEAYRGCVLGTLKEEGFPHLDKVTDVEMLKPFKQPDTKLA